MRKIRERANELLDENGKIKPEILDEMVDLVKKLEKKDRKEAKSEFPVRELI